MHLRVGLCLKCLLNFVFMYFVWWIREFAAIKFS